MLCYLGLSNITAAKSELNEIPEDQRSSPLMLFLAFRIAVCAHDGDLGSCVFPTQSTILSLLAQQSLHALCTTHALDDQYLLGCISEALGTENRHFAARVLAQISDSCLNEKRGCIHLPVLLR